MRLVTLIVGGFAILTASCNSAPPTYPKQLADGCYYAHGKPILEIMGTEGRLLIPGEAQTFKVDRGGDAYQAWAKFTPGILFSDSDDKGVPLNAGIEADGAPITFSMKSGTSVPTIDMHWFVEGHEDVYLGKPCKQGNRAQS